MKRASVPPPIASNYCRYIVECRTRHHLVVTSLVSSFNRQGNSQDKKHVK
jgi:hypothetical protein